MHLWSKKKIIAVQYDSCALTRFLYALDKSFIFIDDDAFLAGWFCSKKAVLQSVIGNCILDFFFGVSIYSSVYPLKVK